MRTILTTTAIAFGAATLLVGASLPGHAASTVLETPKAATAALQLKVTRLAAHSLKRRILDHQKTKRFEQRIKRAARPS